jgi:hypothetical protein
MDTAYLSLVVFIFLMEAVYLASCLIVIIRVIKYRTVNSDNALVTLSTLIFLAACIIGSISHTSPSTFGRIARHMFAFFLIIEIVYLTIIMLVALRSPKPKLLFSVLLFPCIVIIPFLAMQERSNVTYDLLFAYESLIATSISFAYFLQLSDKIKKINVLDEPVTLLMLGLFFCNSLPFAYNTTIATINLLDPSFFTRIEEYSKEGMLLLLVSKVGTLCYIVLNIFIYKAFKCKKQAPVGISL